MENIGISRPAHVFSASMGLAECLSHQAAACLGKARQMATTPQCRHLVHTWGSPADSLHPLTEETHQGLDKSLAEASWAQGHCVFSRLLTC